MLIIMMNITANHNSQLLDSVFVCLYVSKRSRNKRITTIIPAFVSYLFVFQNVSLSYLILWLWFTGVGRVASMSSSSAYGVRGVLRAASVVFLFRIHTNRMLTAASSHSSSTSLFFSFSLCSPRTLTTSTLLAFDE
ncbi:unnamed protein product [Amoebophrya sp. A25]|nr:unnamed protein product [Amoebophrya sp. A25]|eukprot:GSA25T00000159001.1